MAEKKSVRKKPAKQKTAIQSFPCAMLRIGKDHSILEANSPACKILDWPDEVPAHLWLQDLVVSAEQEDLRLLAAKAIEEGEAEGYFHLQFGRVGVVDRLVGRRVHEEDDEWLLAICGLDMNSQCGHMVSEREGKGIRSMERLAGGLAHAFGNLLTSIQGANDLAMMQNAEGLDPAENLAMIHQSVERAKELVAQLIVFSNRHTLHSKQIYPWQSLKALEPVLKMLLPDRLKLIVNYASNVNAITVDETALKRMITLLVQNAREAMSGEGTITIDLEQLQIKQTETGRYGVKAGSWVLIRVSDQGPGIVPALREKIFDPFYTTRLGHVGLGLAVVFVTMSHLEGRVWVEDAPSGGAAFHMLLPVDQSSLKPAASETGGLVKRGAGERVLILEDEADLNRFISMALEKFGYRVWTARSISEAEQRFQAENGKFRLLIADVMLPDGNGFEFAERIHDRYPSLRVLMTSGHAQTVLPDSIMSQRGFIYLAKPFRVSELMDQLNHLVSS